MSAEERLRASGAGVAYGRRQVLDRIDLRIRRGEFVALVGPNGAGKSTLLSVLAGDSVPDAGEIDLDGRSLRSYRAPELALLRSVLTQSNEVSFPFTVAEVVEMGRSPRRGADGAGAAVALALADAEVATLRDRRMPELSGGERARVAYARMRAQECDLVLLDEPTASLDIRHQERLLGQVRSHTESGGSAVVVLHDLGLAAAYADRVVVLEGGRVRADGPPALALTTELLSDVYRFPIRVDADADGVLSIRPERARRTDRPPSDADTRAAAPTGEIR
ncbi:heme ABC transporter ATP-binding protein [Rathayibacter sp. AY2B7]|uniref:heme ABC transporter ATP-binding protein n=1 Tax=unclassified Rathayibacter TaxID=2609250 RepID=UPI000CE82F37|nr:MULTISPECIES: heme ABC transporter ATP-binding protein [unclassified Rathayibacter]PPG07117.1 heme ABC transporter ATP-binding protein [Rathayibacter sp. AY2B1]PPG64461.1 heme ABC transporter ATP-binding protein [Rathayibacter sp. AY2B7]PPG69386.1 heme ABC transporter ATP-binding protein [Rathayibacter sp. AY1F4]